MGALATNGLKQIEMKKWKWKWSKYNALPKMCESCPNSCLLVCYQYIKIILCSAGLQRVILGSSIFWIFGNLLNAIFAMKDPKYRLNLLRGFSQTSCCVINDVGNNLKYSLWLRVKDLRFSGRKKRLLYLNSASLTLYENIEIFLKPIYRHSPPP